MLVHGEDSLCKRIVSLHGEFLALGDIVTLKIEQITIVLSPTTTLVDNLDASLRLDHLVSLASHRVPKVVENLLLEHQFSQQDPDLDPLAYTFSLIFCLYRSDNFFESSFFLSARLI